MEAFGQESQVLVKDGCNWAETCALPLASPEP